MIKLHLKLLLLKLKSWIFSPKLTEIDIELIRAEIRQKRKMKKRKKEEK